MKRFFKTLLRVVLTAVMFVWLLVNVVLIFGEPDGSLVLTLVIKAGGVVSVLAQLFVLAVCKDNGLISLNL